MTAPQPAFSTLDRLLADAPDPALYVPSTEMEQALATAEGALRSGERPVVVTGPPGIGKTLLLRLLAARGAAPDHFLYVPFLAFPADDLARWLLGLLGARARTERTLLGRLRARRKEGGRTVLLVDEAQAIPPETAGRLADLGRRAGDALQLVLAGVEGPALDAALARFETPPLLVPLRNPLTGDDVERTIDRMIDIACEERERKATAWLGGLDGADLLRASGGVPRELRSAMLRRWLGLADPTAAEPGSPVVSAEREEPAAVELLPELEAAPLLVNVNAFPWARIRVDGRDLGTTPLGNVPLAPGPHRFEAKLADGRELHRVVTVGPEQRLVSFR